DSFYRFTSYYGTVVRQSVDLQSAETILTDYEKLKPPAPGAPLSAGWKSISVSGLNFTYETDEEQTYHLQDVAIDLQKGKSIAIVGHSGSGKSTLLTLLRGLQAPGSADVHVDGVRLGHGLSHLAGTTTLMPQDPEIFADTIRNNIVFGMEASQEEI